MACWKQRKLSERPCTTLSDLAGIFDLFTVVFFCPHSIPDFELGLASIAPKRFPTYVPVFVPDINHGSGCQLLARSSEL